MGKIDNIINYFFKGEKEILKDISTYIKDKEWLKLEKAKNKISFSLFSLSDVDKKIYFENLIEDKYIDVPVVNQLLTMLPKEDFLDNFKRLSEILDNEQILSIVHYHSRDLSFIYALWCIDELKKGTISMDNNGFFNSQELVFEYDFFTHMKSFLDDYSFWQNLVHHMNKEQFNIFFTKESLIKYFEDCEYQLDWNDNMIDFIDNDNILYYLKIFKTDTNLIKIIDKLESIDCDDIEQYYLVRSIIQCNTSGDAIVKLLSKTNLKKEEQRELLNLSASQCRI